MRELKRWTNHRIVPIYQTSKIKKNETSKVRTNATIAEDLASENSCP